MTMQRMATLSSSSSAATKSPAVSETCSSSSCPFFHSATAAAAGAGATATVWERGLDCTRSIILYQQSHQQECGGIHNKAKRSRSLPSLLELLQDINFGDGEFDSDDDHLHHDPEEQPPVTTCTDPDGCQTNDDKGEVGDEEKHETPDECKSAASCLDDDDDAITSQHKKEKKQQQQQQVLNAQTASLALDASSYATACRERVLDFFQAADSSSFAPFFSSSSIQDEYSSLYTLSRHEICTGKTLGRGGFAEVRELTLVKAVSNSKQHESRVLSLPKPCQTPSGQARYAIKQVRRELVQQAQNTENHDQAARLLRAGMIDLAVETCFLRHLHHPHIIQLCGVAAARSASDNVNSGMFSPDYFVVLDRLQCTLTTRIHEQWKPRLDRESLAASRWAATTSAQSSSKTASTSASRRLLSILQQRLFVARDISSAIAYLHNMHVCHRDLKPCNVGFDVVSKYWYFLLPFLFNLINRFSHAYMSWLVLLLQPQNGCVKVFDFGLARELPQGRTDKDAVFPLTQMTGTLRFMAPEVGMGEPYNEQCDVYSFALMVWEMLTCTRPYAQLSNEKDFVKKVFGQGLRPKIPTNLVTAIATSSILHSGPGASSGVSNGTIMAAIQDLLQGGWDASVSRRWSIHQMQASLESICTRLLDASSSSSLQQQQRASSSNNKKLKFLGNVMMAQRLKTTSTKAKNRRRFLLLSWPKSLLFLPQRHQQLLHGKRRAAAQTLQVSGRTSRTGEEEEEEEEEGGDSFLLRRRMQLCSKPGARLPPRQVSGSTATTAGEEEDSLVEV
jgi:serine/threonine protein kinase